MSSYTQNRKALFGDAEEKSRKAEEKSRKEINAIITALLETSETDDVMEKERNVKELADIMRDFGKYLTQVSSDLAVRSKEKNVGDVINMAMSEYFQRYIDKNAGISAEDLV